MVEVSGWSPLPGRSVTLSEEIAFSHSPMTLTVTFTEIFRGGLRAPRDSATIVTADGVRFYRWSVRHVCFGPYTQTRPADVSLTSAQVAQVARALREAVDIAARQEGIMPLVDFSAPVMKDPVYIAASGKAGVFGVQYVLTNPKTKKQFPLRLSCADASRVASALSGAPERADALVRQALGLVA